MKLAGTYEKDLLAFHGMGVHFDRVHKKLFILIQVNKIA
jgi:hypothetical protein